MKKSVVLKLPVPIDVDTEKKTYSISYGKVAPIPLKDGSKLVFQFDGDATGKYQIT